MRFRPRRVAVFTAATALLIGGGIVTAVVAQAAVGCQVTYQVTNQWPGGFGANVTIRNLVVGSWNVFSFVRTSNATSLNINLRDFLNNLVSRGWMSSSKFLTSIESGTEVFIGNGRLDTTSYSVTIS